MINRLREAREVALEGIAAGLLALAVIVIAFLIAVATGHAATARSRHPTDANGNLVTVPTAAGIKITVAADFAPKIVPFIADLIARGYHPRKIHCYATGGHVPNSLHYRGEACDFDQSCWGCTARAMYRVGDLVRKYGLRDGGEFRDWGHIDTGAHLTRRHWPRFVERK